VYERTPPWAYTFGNAALTRPSRARENIIVGGCRLGWVDVNTRSKLFIGFLEGSDIAMTQNRV
jgi:hypothetical protein